jgi:hypothetical protein
LIGATCSSIIKRNHLEVRRQALYQTLHFGYVQGQPEDEHERIPLPVDFVVHRETTNIDMRH